MSVSKRNRRKILVRDELFLWWVVDDSEREGFWVLTVVSDADKKRRFHYALYESGLATTASLNSNVPIPESFDRESSTLRDAATTSIGDDRHLAPTPAFVRELIEWHIDWAW